MTDAVSKTIECPFLDLCGFAGETWSDMPELAKQVQENYCTRLMFNQCARFRICQLLGPGTVPPLMLPKQAQWAEQIIQEYGGDLEKDGQPVEAQ